MTEKLLDVASKVALITGSSRETDQALAGWQAGRAARVVVHGSVTKVLDAAGLEIAVHADVVAVNLDVADAAFVAAGIAEFDAIWGVSEILVNSEGVPRGNSCTNFELEDRNDLLASNLTSAFLWPRQSLAARSISAAARSLTSRLCKLRSRIWPLLPTRQRTGRSQCQLGNVRRLHAKQHPAECPCAPLFDTVFNNALVALTARTIRCSSPICMGGTQRPVAGWHGRHLVHFAVNGVALRDRVGDHAPVRGLEPTHPRGLRGVPAPCGDGPSKFIVLRRRP
jgi:short chain dehydrogenase